MTTATQQLTLSDPNIDTLRAKQVDLPNIMTRADARLREATALQAQAVQARQKTRIQLEAKQASARDMDRADQALQDAEEELIAAREAVEYSAALVSTLGETIATAVSRRRDDLLPVTKQRAAVAFTRMLNALNELEAASKEGASLNREIEDVYAEISHLGISRLSSKHLKHAPIGALAMFTTSHEFDRLVCRFRNAAALCFEALGPK